MRISPRRFFALLALFHGVAIGGRLSAQVVERRLRQVEEQSGEKDPIPDLSLSEKVRTITEDGEKFFEVRGTFRKRGWSLAAGNWRLTTDRPDTTFALRIVAVQGPIELEFQARSPKGRSFKKKYIISALADASVVTQKIGAGQQPWPFPAISLGSPTGYGAAWGDVFLGLSYSPISREQRAANVRSKGDGTVGAGMGFGNPENLVGVEASVNIESVYKEYPSGPSDLRLPDLDSGGVALKLHHAFESGFGAAIGAENLVKWGPPDWTPRTFFASMTKVVFFGTEEAWFSALALTAGVGNNRFLPAETYLQKKSGVNAFGAAALRIKEPLTVILDWQGNHLDAGFSVTPFRRYGVYLTGVAGDLAGSLAAGVRYSASLGFSFNFL